MNERIKQLAEEAIEIVAKKRILPDGQIERTWRPEYYDQVFAELIVRECIDKAERYGLGSDAVEQLKEDFGVKE
jgi:hypothetical protein